MFVKLMGAMGAVALVVGVIGCSGSDDDSSGKTGDKTKAKAEQPRPEPQEIAAGAKDFYTVPAKLPVGDHGDLLRYQHLTDPSDGVTSYRVMYLSQSVDGKATVDTGVVTLPTATPPAAGWPLVTHAHGSTGIADACAPSVSLGENRAYAAEVLLMASLAKAKGFVVASTDYEGLGGPGRHPFLVGVSEGRSVLDIARAARRLPGVKVGKTTGIVGYSQGGHAALWANEIAADWTPDLDIVGTMAGAPASELPDLTGHLPAEARAQFAVVLAGGFAAAYHDADPATILTPAGLDVLRAYDGACLGPTDPVPPGPLMKADMEKTEPWASLLKQNEAGTKAAKTPLLIIHSAEDGNVPITDSAKLLDRLCKAGQVVERRVLPTGSHLAAAVPAYQQGFDWVTGLAQGAEPKSSCP